MISPVTTGMGCRVESELVQSYSWTPVVYTLDGALQIQILLLGYLHSGASRSKANLRIFLLFFVSKHCLV